jgi:hypothetical protein
MRRFPEFVDPPLRLVHFPQRVNGHDTSLPIQPSPLFPPPPPPARAAELLPADLDAVILTTGIVPTPERRTSAEGIEMDMAVSTLSRHAILKRLVPRLRGVSQPQQPQARVFVMGFPGAGVSGKLGDLNSEASYAGGLGQTHENTVAGNEALVHSWASRGAAIYGLNPGLIATNIRSPMHNASSFSRALGSVIEGVMRLAAPSAEQYASNVVPLLVAPELDAHKGAMFGQDGAPVLPTPVFADSEYVKKWIAELDALEARALAAAVAGGGATK